MTNLKTQSLKQNSQKIVKNISNKPTTHQKIK